MSLSIKIEELQRRITAYLATGGLFNPEMATHGNVRDLLIDCRELLELAKEMERAAEVRARHPHKTGTALDFEGEIEFLRQLEAERKAKGGASE